MNRKIMVDVDVLEELLEGYGDESVAALAASSVTEDVRNQLREDIAYARAAK